MATINKRGDKWQAKVRRLGQSATRSFLRKEDAERWARKTEADIEAGVFLEDVEASKKITIREAADSLISDYLPKSVMGTVKKIDWKRSWNAQDGKPYHLPTCDRKIFMVIFVSANRMGPQPIPSGLTSPCSQGSTNLLFRNGG